MSAIQPYKQVLNFLMEIIEQAPNEPNYRLPSERMLAIKFRASRRSVRMAYEKLLSQGIVEKIHGKGYFTTGKSKHKHDALTEKSVHLIAPYFHTRFSQEIAHGVFDFCNEHTMDLSIKLSMGNLSKEAQYIQSAFSSNVKGIILFPTDNELINHELLKLSANRYPIAIIDRYFKNVNSSFISTDNYGAMMDAVRFLSAKKHKRILYLTSPTSLATTVEERLNGYLAGYAKYFGEGGERTVLTLQNFGISDVAQAVHAHLTAHPDTEVLLTSGSRTAIDAIVATANKLGFSFPKDLKLMVFDNEFSDTEIHLLRPYVIQQDARQIGYQAAATLYNQIYGDLRTKTIRLPAHIVDYTKAEELPTLQ